MYAIGSVQSKQNMYAIGSVQSKQNMYAIGSVQSKQNVNFQHFISSNICLQLIIIDFID